MRVELFDYQEDAVRSLVDNMVASARQWKEDNERSAFTLSAPTASGKTVMAAAVIESVIYGTDELTGRDEGVAGDANATFLWISQDPSLNEQSRKRLAEVSDRLHENSLIVLDDSYQEDKLRPGNVYFINPAKLRKGGRLGQRGNNRQYSFWDILDRTIDDRASSLYVIFDEAHQGMKKQVTSDRTLVSQILDGHKGENGNSQPVPVVFGISATAQRFQDAMGGSRVRTLKPSIDVDPKKVQQSGLIKSTVSADIPAEIGAYGTTLLTEATDMFVKVSKEWAEFCEENDAEPVIPLMILQIPNRKNAKDLRGEDTLLVRLLDTVRDHWPGFTTDSVAHVLGDRDDIDIGQYRIEKVAPELIQEDTSIRILIAKDAVSTGWDCPRAEVFFSLRPAQDRTYITQLLGRMLRTPLAQSTSQGLLNSTSMFLPRFDRETAQSIIDEITGEGSGLDGTDGTGPNVLLEPLTIRWNPHLSDEVSDVVDALPSSTVPRMDTRPIGRMFKAATLLAADRLVENPNAQAEQEMCGVLDGVAARYPDAVKRLYDDVLTVEILRITSDIDGKIIEEKRQVAANKRDVEGSFRVAGRQTSTTVMDVYFKHVFAKELEALAEEMGSDEDPEDHADYMDVKAQATAVGLAVLDDSKDTVLDLLEAAAEKLVTRWLDDAANTIGRLPELRQNKYEVIRTGSRESQPLQISPPTSLLVETVRATKDGYEPLDRVDRHLLSDDDGTWPIQPRINNWERQVIETELADDGIVAWYRNQTSAKTSLCVPYWRDGKWSGMYPDFIFIEKIHDGTLKPSIVDPHGAHLSDSKAKLLALADYAEKHDGHFIRIDAVSSHLKNGSVLRRLDLAQDNVRRKVREHLDAGKSVSDLYAPDSGVSQSY